MTDTKQLNEVIKRSKLKKNQVAKFLNITRSCLWLKINNKREFRASEITKLTVLLNLTQKQRDDIFLKGR